MGILQKEAELQEVVQLVGYDALPEKEKSVLDIAKMIREDFLQQSAFDDIDTYCSLNKQFMMLSSIIRMGKLQSDALDRGVTMSMLQGIASREKISRMKEVREDDFRNYYEGLMAEMEQQITGLKGGR
jgi:V/A-type H+-transporting ATPase subunit A